MSKEDLIYTITTLEKLEPSDNFYCEHGDTRCVGFYHDKESAERSVEENCCDIWEYLYDYVVIEATPPGVYGTSSSGCERWFYKFNQETERYEPIEEPECVKHIYGFGIG